MRGRNRPKGPNPLTRSYESNGPDVKIRGTAQHIADKYAQLARDALASGDPIAAENYFQHGEHYFRIITGAQEPGRPQASQGYARNGFDEDEEGDEEASGAENGRQGFGYGSDEYGDFAQQPQPFERHDFDNRQQDNRQPRNDRGQRFQPRNDRNDRGQRFEGNRQDYGNRGGEPRQDFRGDRQDRQDRQDFRQDRRQDFRQDYGQPQDGGREAGRENGGRFDQGRREPPREAARGEPQEAVRQEVRQEPRQESRQDARQQDTRQEARGEAPRAEAPVRPEGAPPRRGRQRGEFNREPADPSALPAFLMTATRNPPPAAPAEAPEAEAPRPAPEPAPAVEAAAPPPAAEEAPAPKPRRRRTRYKGAEGEAAPESTDTPSAAE